VKAVSLVATGGCGCRFARVRTRAGTEEKEKADKSTPPLEHAAGQNHQSHQEQTRAATGIQIEQSETRRRLPKEKEKAEDSAEFGYSAVGALTRSSNGIFLGDYQEIENFDKLQK